MNIPAFIPILRVKDARNSERFYREKFGFTRDWEHQFAEGYPLLIAVSCGERRIFLSEHKGTGTDHADLYAYVPDVDALHAELAASETTIEQAPADQPWGVRDMQVRDPDGHRFTFATTLPR